MTMSQQVESPGMVVPGLKVDENHIPKTMVDALDRDDPVQALIAISNDSREKAMKEALKLQERLDQFVLALPDALKLVENREHPITAATASVDSIYNTLNKIASGGSQASQEIRQLEQEKSDVEQHANAMQIALTLRRNSDRALQALQTRQWHVAADAVIPWLEWKSGEIEADPRIRAYAGEYCLQQLSSAYDRMRETLLQQYESAVQNSDLQSLGQLTPVLSKIRLEQEAVRLYLQFLKGILQSSVKQALNQPNPQGQTSSPPYLPMARVYNTAVACLRHHLPMVSHCLYKADGDAAVVQLVQAQVEEAVLPLVSRYQRDRQLSKVSRDAQRIYAALEERYTGRSVVDESANDSTDDCGFSVSIGTLSDADAAMDEAALCIQHSESYLRFIQHTCNEVNKARQIRFDQVQKQARMDRELLEMTSGGRGSMTEEEKSYEPLLILPVTTPLHFAMAELGGQYASIERCLLLASMQRAFVSSDADARYYRPLSLTMPGSMKGHDREGSTLQPLQTSLVETCLFAARRGSQRAFATGHTGTASAMTNFCVDCLKDILLEVLTQRAEESGVALLRPGEGLLVGSAGLFNNASNLIRHGTQQVGSAVAGAHQKDELVRRQKIQEGIARACATLNDLEVAIGYIKQLELMLAAAVSKGFAPDQHETEQLVMCVKALGPVADSIKIASNATIESLESVLRPRLRSIVGEAVGGEGSAATTFMGSAVIGGGKATDRVMARMNYNLDEDAYNIIQASEGYVVRLCTLLDELLDPLRIYLAPRLWDTLLLSVLGTISKRLESSLRKCQFTALGAVALDSDMRDILNYIKEKLYSPEYGSNIAVTKACPSFGRLLQIAKLLSVDDLEDVLDLISNAQRKGNWDLKLEDAKALLSSRVEFEGTKVNELLRIPEEN